MAGIVTSKRSWPFTEELSTVQKGTSIQKVVFPGNQLVQSTTSWRTSGGPDVETNMGDTPTTEADVFKFLIGEAKRRDENPRNVYDTGHEFSTSRDSVVHMPRFSANGIRTTGTTSHWEGPVIPFSYGVTGFPLIPVAPSFTLASKLGAIAISKTAPTNPASTFGQGFGETIGDGLPGIPGEELKRRIGFFRSLGKEYLNIQFGWAPFVSDLRSSIKAVLNHHKLLSQLQRDSGRPVRRTYSFAPIRSSQVLGTAAGSLLAPVEWSSGDWDSSPTGRGLVNTSGSTYQLISETTTKAWFKGCFIYYLPDGSSFLDQVNRFSAQAEYLLSIQLNPELLWQLAPWSWLVDWFTHLGRYITQATRFSSDGLVLKYGYMMATTSVTYHHQIQNWSPGTGSGYGKPRSDVLMTQNVRKERFRSTPYGFGVDTSSLSAFQWSILAALGLTKAPHKLF